jgi:hypothetical protein
MPRRASGLQNGLTQQFTAIAFSCPLQDLAIICRGIPYVAARRWLSLSVDEKLRMPSPVDQKMYWDLFETLSWISTRDEQLVAAMWDRSDEERAALALFRMRVRRDVRSLPGPWGSNIGADLGPAGPQEGERTSQTEGSLGHPLDDLHRKVHSGRIQMIAVRLDGTGGEQRPVPTAELNDLSFRIDLKSRRAPAGLWSRSQDRMVWRSPQFLRADVIRAWPARNTKTTAVYVAILRHLQEVMTPEAPLTKLEAQKRCLAEVPNAYSAAFKKAWAELDPSCKRGRGKHGRRTP